MAHEKNDLIRQLRERLDILELVRERVELKRAGRAWLGLCPFHQEKTPSFNVWADIGAFKCFGCGQSGDQFTWLAFQKFNTVKPAAEQFIEVLKEGCRIANLDWEQFNKQNPKAAAFSAQRRRNESVLELYVQAAELALDRPTLSRIQAIKPWITEEICRKWRLGYAPTLEQCEKLKLSASALADVGILRQHDDTGAPFLEPRLFFRDSIIIPFMEASRVVYVADRTLGDRKPKSLSMHAPGHDGKGGMPRPDGFNLDVMYKGLPVFEDATARHVVMNGLEELLLVEGPLDAVACCERGHAAVAMITSRPSEGLVKKLRRLVA